MTDVYIHINHLRTRFLNKYIPEVISYQDLPKEPIIQHKMFLSEATGIKRMYDIIRLLSNLCEVTVVRNDYNSYEGITIIGRVSLVSLFNDLLNSIINKILKSTSAAPRNPKNKIHLAEFKAVLRSKAVMKYEALFRELIKTKTRDEDYWYWIKDRELRDDYITSSPLKAFKKFRPYKRFP